jgi:phenylacetate-CoA ligase
LSGGRDHDRATPAILIRLIAEMAPPGAQWYISKASRNGSAAFRGVRRDFVQLSNPDLDAMTHGGRQALLLEALRDQVEYAAGAVPFWADRLARASVSVHSIGTMEDFARLSIMSKAEFRGLRPEALVAEDPLFDVRIARWTSGTSGQPTVCFWTTADWAALVAATARMLARRAPLATARAFNGYSQAHLTGPLYHAALQRLGGVVFDRSHHAEEVFSTEAQAELFDFDTLILPGRTTRGKGLGLADLIERDPEFLRRHGVRWWIGSSGTFEAAIVEAARRQGVTRVSNLYGASEFGLFAIMCEQNIGDYHVAQGHVLVEVVDDGGFQVESGSFGRIVVTHLCGATPDGHARNHQGTQLFRLAIGDGATLIEEPCACGLTTSRLRGIRRLP